jgi:hypothetical protein
MGDVWLTWLADELRRAGLKVVECDGWKTRARSSGGYEPGRPWCVMWHHTASATGGSAANDVAYMLSPSNDAYPTANLYVARNGEVWVMAAGCSNTNGKGSGVRTTSRGTVPVDSMNTYAVGVEIGNNGVGEPYSQACIDAAFATSLVVTANCGLAPSDVIHHQAYAPDRKVDPATATAVQGGWRPRSVTSSGTWSLDDLKAECNRRAGAGGGTAPAPQPPTPEPAPPKRIPLEAFHDEGEPMFVTMKDNIYWVGNGIGRRKCADTSEVDFLIEKFKAAGTPLRNFQGGQQVTARSQINASQQLGRLGVDVAAK